MPKAEIHKTKSLYYTKQSKQDTTKRCTMHSKYPVLSAESSLLWLLCSDTLISLQISYILMVLENTCVASGSWTARGWCFHSKDSLGQDQLYNIPSRCAIQARFCVLSSESIAFSVLSLDTVSLHISSCISIGVEHMDCARETQFGSDCSRWTTNFSECFGDDNATLNSTFKQRIISGRQEIMFSSFLVCIASMHLETSAKHATTMVA